MQQSTTPEQRSTAFQKYGPGFPVLVFRAFILFGFLKALRGWWQARARMPRAEIGLANP